MSPEGANEFLYWSKLLDWRNETLTPNPDLIYYMAFMDPGGTVRSWSTSRRRPADPLDLPRAIPMVLYWLTETGASAARSYWEDRQASAAAAVSGQAPPEVSVPTGFTTFPGEIWRTRVAGPRTLTPTSPTSAKWTGRPLRRLGGAGALLHRGASRLQVSAPMTPSSSALPRRTFNPDTDH
jgi:hypothetical protein